MARGGAGRERIHLEVTGLAVFLGGLALVAFVAWMLGGGDLQLAAAVAMVVALGVELVLARLAIKRSVVSLRPPELVEADRPSYWIATVVGARRPVSLRFVHLGASEDVLAVDERPGALVVQPLPRGVIPFVIVDLKARGPLGLLGAGKRVVVSFATPIPVVPPPIEHPARWPRVRARAFGTEEGAPVGDDLYRTVRPYRYGDERRRVHWRSTARRGELMVRESEGLGFVRVRIVVDLGPPGPVAEQVAGTAQWLVGEALKRNWRVDLVTLDSGGVVPRLASLGRTFGPLPVIAPPPVMALPTVVAPVSSRHEIGRRLATAAYGTPIAPDGAGDPDIACRIGPAGVVWS